VVRDSGSAEFFDAAARGELLVQKCASCGTVLTPEARTCLSCGSVDLGPTVVSGLGRLISWVVVHQAPIPVLKGAVPYVSAVVELDEGPWLMVRLIAARAPGDGTVRVEIDPLGLAVGERVRVDFVQSGAGDDAGEWLPVFRRAAPTGESA
jgi:uncharacterized OB-fold protein